MVKNTKEKFGKGAQAQLSLRWFDIVLALAVLAVALMMFTEQPEKNIYAVMDESEVVQSRLDEGDSPVEALVYFNVLRQVYASKGVIVFDKEALVTYPKEFEAVLPAKDMLFEMSKQAGMPVTRKNFDDAQKEMEEKRAAMLRALNIQQ
jgi:hypothetical protein